MPGDALFSFSLPSLPADTFHVVGFKGTEGLSQLYEFQIELVSARADIDLASIPDGRATLILHRETGDLPIHGIVARLEQLRSVDGYVFYQALLVPRLWWLTLTRHNQVFLDLSAPEFLAQVLQDSGALGAADFEFRLTQSYVQREYVCQYDESHYHFLTRWLEHEGLYFFFEQGAQGEKLVITDNAIAHTHNPNQPPLQYLKAKGLDAAFRKEACSEFICEQNLLPGKVRVKDYNYRTPTVDLLAETEVHSQGMGDLYFYGDNCKTKDEAKRQSVLRAEEARCQQVRYKGRSTAAFLRAGTTFSLQGHYRHSVNADYLPLLVKHEGTQTGYLLAGLGRCLSDRQAKNFYGNVFMAIPAQVQYRHHRKTPRPRFYGSVTAFIDGEGSGQYAELDNMGRYKVRLPFDLSGRPDGKASCWIRKAEPYGGPDHGMHFPLHKGTEVLLTFIGGDVDRPIIAAAVPNFVNQSLVKDQNAPANAIRSARGNQLVIGDKEGQEFIGLYSPFHRSGIAVGSSEPGGGGCISLATDGALNSLTLGAKNFATIGAANTCVIGNNTSATIGLKGDITAAQGFACDLGSRVQYTYGSRISLGQSATELSSEVSKTGLRSITFSGGSRDITAHLKESAHKALWIGLAGSLASAAGTVGLAQPWGEKIIQGVLEHQEAVYGTSGALELVGLLCSIYGYKKTKEIVEQFSAATNEDCTARLKLDRQGAAITVNGNIGVGATFKAEVNAAGPNSPAAGKSSIIIGPDGQDVSLTNKAKASIKLMGGNSALVDAKTVLIKGEESSITLEKNIKMKFSRLEAEKLLRVNNMAGTIDLA